MDRRICTFDEATHTYYLDGEKVISVTQLLAEQNITSDYSKANPMALAFAIARGNTLHEEIQRFIEEGLEGFSDEFQYFKNVVYPLREKWYCEVIVYCDDYAGRCDLIGVSENKPTWVLDTKTGSSWKKPAVSWQTSLYARCIPELVGKDVELKCLDLHECQLVDLERIDEKEIKKLLKCHKEGKTYQEPQLVVASDSVGKMLALETAVVQLETAVTDLKAQRDRMREEFKKMFVEQKAKEFSSPNLKITYVAPTKVDGGIDKDKLKKDYPEAYKACKKADTSRKDYVTVTIRSAT